MPLRLTRRALLTCGALFAAGRALSIRKLTTRKHTLAGRDYLFLEIETDGAIAGIGEGSISGRVEIVEKAIQWFTPFLEGREPAGIEEHWNRNYYELSGIRSRIRPQLQLLWCEL